MRRNIVYILLVAMIALALTSDILNHAYVDHIECKTNKEYCSNYTCKLSFKTRSVKQLTWTCYLTKRVDVVNTHVILYYRFRTGYKQFLIDVTSDYCGYHSHQIGSSILDLIAGMFKNYTKNLWRPCPFYKGDLALTNLPLTSKLVKNIFVPAGEYKLTLNTTVGVANATSLTLFTSISLFISVPGGRVIENDSMG